MSVYGGGTDRTDATFNAALNSVGTQKVTFFISPGDWVLSNNVTIPANVMLDIPNGAVLDGTATLTIQSPYHIRAGLKQQIFSTALTVSFVYGGLVTMQWWNDSAGDGSTDIATEWGLAVAIS